MKLMKKLIKGFFILIAILIVGYLMGPKVKKPNLDITLPNLATNLKDLERKIAENEALVGNIKPDNAAKIIWFDSIPAKTTYSIVYLHGWSASRMEGNPIHIQTAKKFGCNLYLPRLAGHGLDEQEPMMNITSDAVINSAKEAIAVAKMMGEKVIVMATSTGGTLALHLAQGDPDIAAIILYSPNIEIYDPNAKLLSGPWGLQLARLVKQSNYHEFESTTEKKKYWTTNYRLESLTQLQSLIDNTMVPETFQNIKQPVFLGYYYKNESLQDQVVSVPAMLEMYNQLGTPNNLKRKEAFAETGNHVMTSYLTSKDLESVQIATNKFLMEVLGLEVISTGSNNGLLIKEIL